MADIAQIRAVPAIDADTLDKIQDMVDAARRGEIVDIVCVANHRADGAFWAISEYGDGWRMLGAIEYAKSVVAKAILAERG